MILRTLLLCLMPCLALAEPPGPRITGAEEVVFDWAEDRCETWDIPDAPARAWRDAEGQVHLLAGSDQSRAATGPDLDHLTRDCAILHRGAKADDPAAWDDRTWIAAVHSKDGRHITALAHMEYHGHRRPDGCPSGDYASCWYNAVIELQSGDGGSSFSRLGGTADVVAAPGQAYSGDVGRRLGYFNPSNILEDNGYLYAFIFAEAAGLQRRGACLIRRPLQGGPKDWRAWGDQGFDVRFIDPYAEPEADPGQHVCRPVPGLRSAVSSVVRHRQTGAFLAVTPMVSRDGTTGVFWTVSTDLVTWSAPRLLYRVPLLWRRDCDQPAAYAYPSLIDPDSPSLSFDTVDDGFWLYLTRMPLQPDCSVSAQRDLVRLPVSWDGSGPPR